MKGNESKSDEPAQHSLDPLARRRDRRIRFTPRISGGGAVDEHPCAPASHRRRGARWSLWLADLGLLLAGVAQLIPEDLRRQLIELLVRIMQSL